MIGLRRARVFRAFDFVARRAGLFFFLAFFMRASYPRAATR